MPCRVGSAYLPCSLVFVFFFPCGPPALRTLMALAMPCTRCREYIRRFGFFPFTKLHSAISFCSSALFPPEDDILPCRVGGGWRGGEGGGTNPRSLAHACSPPSLICGCLFRLYVPALHLGITLAFLFSFPSSFFVPPFDQHTHRDSSDAPPNSVLCPGHSPAVVPLRLRAVGGCCRP